MSEVLVLRSELRSHLKLHRDTPNCTATHPNQPKISPKSARNQPEISPKSARNQGRTALA
eukprot:16427-Rhodomonas_salina.1